MWYLHFLLSVLFFSFLVFYFFGLGFFSFSEFFDVIRAGWGGGFYYLFDNSS